jgi:hypothetical protein
MRVAGRLEGYALGFDTLGKVLLVAQPKEPVYGTVTVADGRLTSGNQGHRLGSFGRPLGLVRIKI